MLRTVCVSKSKTAETLYHLKFASAAPSEFFNSVPLNAISLDDTTSEILNISFSLESLKIISLLLFVPPLPEYQSKSNFTTSVPPGIVAGIFTLAVLPPLSALVVAIL